ncbi:MAG TPA: serine/threonine-protein kinase [Bryobacteraceae bacterium]|nr:serine/threonine-protein kinase [Bryobacteraceae bacterium]
MEQIGRYRVMAELGRGAMGVVYRALDPAIGRTVAIKTIRLADFADAAELARLRERLLREARAAGVLSHPNIVTVYDVGEEQGVAWIAMEFAGGPTLEELLSRQEPLEPEAVLRILRQTAAALDYAHGKGIVHRDVKPANIVIQEDGTVKITDFGIARDAASRDLTHAGTVVGTPSYMSPEQVEGRSADGRSDQFSLAVIAYEMLTGEKPFAREPLPALLYQIAHEEPAPPQHINPTLGRQVEAVLRKALAKRPEDRYETCTAFVRALEGACGASPGWRPLPRGAGQSLPTAEVKAVAARPAPAPAPKRKRRLWPAAFAVLAVAAAAGGIWWRSVWFRSATPAPEVPAPAVEVPEVSQRPSPAGPRREAPAPAVAPELPAAEPAEEVAAPATEESRPQARSGQAASTPAASGGEVSVVLVRTSPPGAVVMFDRNPALSCKTPCSISLAPGRHTASASLAGHRPAMRIFEVPGETDLFLYLAPMTGQVQIISEPPGAAILLNGNPRRETTPATIELPAGRHTVTVVKEGRKAEQEIEVKDGAFVRINFVLSP